MGVNLVTFSEDDLFVIPIKKSKYSLFLTEEREVDNFSASLALKSQLFKAYHQATSWSLPT
jgi:hypothetical protein